MNTRYSEAYSYFLIGSLLVGLRFIIPASGHLEVIKEIGTLIYKNIINRIDPIN